MPLPTDDSADMEIPEQIGPWLQAKIDEGVGKVMDDDVLHILTLTKLDDERKWIEATEVLKKSGVLTPVKKAVKQAVREEMARRLQARRKTKVHLSQGSKQADLEFMLAGVNFIRVKHLIYRTKPRLHKMFVKMKTTGEEHELEFSNPTLNTAKKFEEVFRDCTDCEAMGLPTKRDEWKMIVGYWLETASKVDMSEDSSEMGHLIAVARERLWSLPLGETADDVEHLHIAVHPRKEGMYVIGKTTFHAHLNKALGGKPIPASVFAMVVQGMRGEDDRTRIHGRQVRVITFPWDLGDPEGAPPDPVAAGRFRKLPGARQGEQSSLLEMEAPNADKKGDLN